MNSAADMIYWTPPARLSRALRMAQQGVVLLHVCPTAVIVAPVRREELDPMALGECRYCRESMPDAI